MEFQNSIYVDRRMFPAVQNLTVLEAGQFMNSRLRSGPGEHNVRLDISLVAFDGKSVANNSKSVLIGAVVKPQKGITLLRHFLGHEAANFTHVILDPETPDVVNLIGPRAVPEDLAGLQLTSMEELLVKFSELNRASQATTAMLHFVSTRNPAESDLTPIEMGNGYSIQCGQDLDGHPVFIIRSLDKEVKQ